MRVITALVYGVLVGCRAQAPTGKLGPARTCAAVIAYKVPGHREYPPSTLIPSQHTMASRRAVTVLRPVGNAAGPRLLKTGSLQNSQFQARTLASQVWRPRKTASQPPQQVRYASSGAGKEQLGKTALYEIHSKYGAKFVPFGGYSMPVQYSDLGIVDSHNWTRENASLFDVGHM